MKPLHEETLTVVPESHGRLALVASDGSMVATTRAADGVLIAQRLASGPALAKALLAVAEPHITADGPCWCIMQATDGSHPRKACQDARAALRQAGSL